MSSTRFPIRDRCGVSRCRSTIRRGFTVLELIVGATILSIVLGTVAVAMRIQADDVRGSRDDAAREAGTARWGTRWRRELAEAESIAFDSVSRAPDGAAMLDSITLETAGGDAIRYRIEAGGLVRERREVSEGAEWQSQDRLTLPGLNAARLERLEVAGTEQFAIVWEGTDARRSEGLRHRSLGRRWLAARTASPLDARETAP